MMENFRREYVEPNHTIFVFALLTCKPEIFENNSIVSRALKKDVAETSRINNVSSAFPIINKNTSYILILSYKYTVAKISEHRIKWI